MACNLLWSSAVRVYDTQSIQGDRCDKGAYKLYLGTGRNTSVIPNCFQPCQCCCCHDELTRHMFDLERDWLRQVVLCPQMTMWSGFSLSLFLCICAWTSDMQDFLKLKHRKLGYCRSSLTELALRLSFIKLLQQRRLCGVHESSTLQVIATFFCLCRTAW